MREGDAAFEALRSAIEALAAAEAPALIEEARAEARVKVRSILAEAMAQALLDRSSEALAEEGGEHRSAGPGPGAGQPPAGEAARTRGASSPARQAPRDAGTRAEEAPAPQAPRGPASSGGGPADEALGWYVYCVARSGSLAVSEGRPGIDPEHAVTEVVEGPLAALASRVPLSEFGEDRLRENLNDVGWLEAKARAHEGVLDEALASATVIPMRLCTLYSGEEALREMLRSERESLLGALERLEGTSEWGVKLFADRAVLERAAVAGAGETGSPEEAAEGASGQAYLRRRGDQIRARDDADRLADEWADEVHRRAAAEAREALQNPLQRPEISGHSGEMLLNGVYLVESGAVGAFRAAVDDLAGALDEIGLRAELTGPWPPYNFVGSSIEAAR